MADGASATSSDTNVSPSQPSHKDVSSAYLAIAELYMTDLW